MPQPATHYLVARRAIPQEHWGNWWDKYKPYFGLGSSAPDLFYFPLLPKSTVRTDIVWEDMANPMHSFRSYDMFCSLLSKAKINKLQGNPNSGKQFAFSLGYYCHVVTDCIFHPYVYRSTGDYWSSTDFKHELQHKLQEFSIDTGIVHKFYGKENFSRIQWECKDETENLLDYSIAQLFQDSLQEVYSDCYPSSPDVMDSNHPIQQAYSALVKSIPTLFEGSEIYLWGQRITINPREFLSGKQDDFFTSPYPNCDTLDSYTPEELFNLSSGACRKIFIASLGFWEDGATSAKEYFKTNSTHYLNSENWNLDTGLPCHYNNYRLMRSTEAEHYFFRAEELRQTFATLKAEYDTEFTA